MRLDVYLTVNKGIESRAKAQNMIKLGKVTVDGKPATKVGMEISDSKNVEILSELDYSSMGGYKLEKAIQDFKIDFQGLKAIDIGASNGGFTDCMLRNGVQYVYAVDVGECAFSEVLRNDPRVVIRDRINAKELTVKDVDGYADIIVIDVSFISLTYILANMASLLTPNGRIVALVKPQFEAGQKHLNKKGIVLDEKVREKVLAKVIAFAEECGLKLIAKTTAPIREKKNIEYLIYLQKDNN